MRLHLHWCLQRSVQRQMNFRLPLHVRALRRKKIRQHSSDGKRVHIQTSRYITLASQSNIRFSFDGPLVDRGTHRKIGMLVRHGNLRGKI